MKYDKDLAAKIRIARTEIIPYHGISLCSLTADNTGAQPGAELSRERMFQEDKEELDPSMITRVCCGVWGLIINLVSSC